MKMHPRGQEAETAAEAGGQRGSGGRRWHRALDQRRKKESLPPGEEVAGRPRTRGSLLETAAGVKVTQKAGGVTGERSENKCWRVWHEHLRKRGGGGSCALRLARSRSDNTENKER
ncbi:hypothetical protein EYF80_052940 [Liparis tanakae]|uniref:Uncharacterized protein n=1 Tax=Liparis tanakae TaxID=230148 RepID=A0A4Z2F7L9_9TELE|nr:hypothetical protein EYF80_052940 [Liparis tanakae]